MEATSKLPRQLLRGKLPGRAPDATYREILWVEIKKRITHSVSNSSDFL